MKTPYEIYQEMEGFFDEKFPCIQSDCDGGGNIPVGDNENGWHAEQCEFHAKYLFPLKSHNRNSLIAILKALEGQVKNWRYSYERYPIMMQTKKSFEKGEMAQELADEFLPIITDLIANLEK